mgnify:CR=1 FL=1
MQRLFGAQKLGKMINLPKKSPSPTNVEEGGYSKVDVALARLRRDEWEDGGDS